MIIHCVFCSFKDNVSEAQRGKVLEQLSEFSLGLEGVLAFDFGPNRDFEKKSPDHSDGFVIRFRNKEALQAYAIHPTHKRLGIHLCELCHGGGEGIIVFDLEISS